MGTKARVIFHRGVPMGLEVVYKVFVRDDTGFLDSIHPLSDIDVDITAWVSDGEEELFYNHLVGNSLRWIRMYWKLDIWLLR